MRDIVRPSVAACILRDAHLLCYRHARWKRLLIAASNRGFHALVFYRLANWCWVHNIPLLPLLLTRTIQILYGIDIAPQATLGPGIVIFHGCGLVVGSESRIEGDCRLYHGVTFGTRGTEWIGSDVPDGHPFIEKNCIISAGAKVLGPITVGSNTVIGANAVVLNDLPPNSIAGGIPAKVLSVRPPMDAELRRIPVVLTSVRSEMAPPAA